MRIAPGVNRGDAFAIVVDGAPVAACLGETIATAMLAARRIAFQHGKDGPRGLYCNMGTCSECLVTLREAGTVRRVRACVVEARPGQSVETGG